MTGRVNEDFPTTGRLAGIDFGTVRIGIAICDPGQTIASPLENYTRQPDQEAGYFKQLVDHEQIVGFVVGLPIHMSGDESQKSIQARAFGKWLSETTGLPVIYFDERMSTAAAAELLNQSSHGFKKKKSKLDKVAAQIILSAFLESNSHSEHHGSIEEND